MTNPEPPTAAAPVSKTELLRRAAALVPVLRERAAATEKLRRVPDETVRDLIGAGLIQAANPLRYGGYPDVDVDTTFEISWELGRGCGSSAWCYAVWTVHNWIMGHFPAQAQEDYFATGLGTLSSSAFHLGTKRVERVEGGWRVGGQWDFSSGVDAAGWAMVALHHPGGIVWILVPKRDYEIVDNWYVSGLCGTGSKDVLVRDAFIPDHRTLEPLTAGETDLSGWEAHGRLSYRMPMRGTILGWDLVAPLVGIAQGGVDAFIARTAGTTGSRRSAEAVNVQLRLAESAAEVHAGRVLFRHTLDEMLAKAARGETYSDEERARYVRDKALVVKLCLQAVNRLFEGAGGHALYTSEPLQRIHRDANALVHRAGMLMDFAGEAWGRAALGLPSV